VRDSLGISDVDAPAAAAEKIRGGLAAAGLDVAAGAPYVAHLLGLGIGVEPLAALRPEEIKARTFEILRQLSLGRSRRSPRVLVIGDLHGIAATSEEYLASLAQVVGPPPIMLITTHRPGYRPPWAAEPPVTRMALRPLARADSLTVVRSVVGAGGAADPLIAIILAQAEGNPVFLEELARAVRDGGGGGDPAVPDTIEQVIQARIDRLPLPHRNLLQEASVVGTDVPLALLRAVTDQSDEMLQRALAELTGSEFLQLAGEGQYTFKHALTHEV